VPQRPQKLTRDVGRRAKARRAPDVISKSPALMMTQATLGAPGRAPA